MNPNSCIDLKEVIYRLVRQIPKGKVATYGQISNQLRINNGELRINPRVVGWMLHANRSADVPCHRVVDRNGRIAPNFGGPSLKSFGHRAGPSKSSSSNLSDLGIEDLTRRSGGFGGADEQRHRLMGEGVKFKDEMHVDLESCRWQE